MIKINIHEAKTHLSYYLTELEKGETILLCKRNEPVAEIRPILLHSREARPIGLAKGIFSIPPAFFEELSEDIVSEFEGKSE